MKTKEIVIQHNTENKEYQLMYAAFQEYKVLKERVKQFTQQEQILKDFFKNQDKYYKMIFATKENDILFTISKYDTTRKTLDIDKTIDNILTIANGALTKEQLESCLHYKETTSSSVRIK